MLAYYALPTANSGVRGLVSDGTNLWVGCINSNEWIRITTAGVATAYTCPTPFTVASAAGNGQPDKLCYLNGAIYSPYHNAAKIAQLKVV